MLQRVWQELDYRLYVCRVTQDAHIEHSPRDETRNMCKCSKAVTNTHVPYPGLKPRTHRAISYRALHCITEVGFELQLRKQSADLAADTKISRQLILTNSSIALKIGVYGRLMNKQKCDYALISYEPQLLQFSKQLGSILTKVTRRSITSPKVLTLLNQVGARWRNRPAEVGQQAVWSLLVEEPQQCAGLWQRAPQQCLQERVRCQLHHHGVCRDVCHCLDEQHRHYQVVDMVGSRGGLCQRYVPARLWHRGAHPSAGPLLGTRDYLHHRTSSRSNNPQSGEGHLMECRSEVRRGTIAEKVFVVCMYERTGLGLWSHGSRLPSSIFRTVSYRKRPKSPEMTAKLPKFLARNMFFAQHRKPNVVTCTIGRDLHNPQAGEVVFFWTRNEILDPQLIEALPVLAYTLTRHREPATFSLLDSPMNPRQTCLLLRRSVNLMSWDLGGHDSSQALHQLDNERSMPMHTRLMSHWAHVMYARSIVGCQTSPGW
ncbi:hypothetical protein PR048_020749 [Dryococelus australis]|uniref:Uncharacterized protein n=1 Tax=Dryococelus australis TaxID=614101 RepID=A0ABQ9GW99_9NEOP|nr:hypothetical protein PR048_020749 [Dryococelus australis]